MRGSSWLYERSYCCCCCEVASVVSDSVRPHRQQPTRLPLPWESPGKNPGVGCHFLLRSMKVKSQSEVTQSCPTLSGPMDCSLPGSSVHGIFQASVLEWGAIVFSKRRKGSHEIVSSRLWGSVFVQACSCFVQACLRWWKDKSLFSFVKIFIDICYFVFSVTIYWILAMCQTLFWVMGIQGWAREAGFLSLWSPQSGSETNKKKKTNHKLMNR